jgi:polyphosphate kinase
MVNQEKYFNRDLSWLSFNDRVLKEAYDHSLPLYERIKFLAIFSNNLEEFYRVRVSYYRSLLRNLDDKHPKIIEIGPKQVIYEVNKMVSRQQAEFNQLFYDIIIPELRKYGVILVDDTDEISLEQDNFIYHTFRHEILPAIQPVLLVRKRIKPFLKTGHMYIALQMFTKIDSKRKRSFKALRGKIPKYGLIKLPTDHGISRFIELPVKDNKYYIMFLEDMIMRHANDIFPGYWIGQWFSIKVTRDADLEYEDYDGEDLIEIIENIETTRAVGLPNRFQFDSNMPQNMLNFFTETFGIDPEVKVKGGRTHNFRDFFTFPNPLSPKLEHEKFMPLKVTDLESDELIFDTVLKKDILLHFPYQSFDYFIKFLEEAGNDEKVTEIKTTMYRVATNSAVVDSLIKAALKGKKVRVFVELKARFDESANLEYSKEMEKAGITIIYSLPGLKVHSKLAMVTRKNAETGEGQSVLFLGTGNFNEKTARIYCDEGLFTANQGLINEINVLFNLLESKNFKNTFERILVPNFNLVPTFSALINREMKNVEKGKRGYIILKMNGLEDPYMIDRLYEASQAGVKIDCIIRGVCRLIPEKPFSKNIRVVRIVDRFLEHSRMFYFFNDGDPVVYLGSADWMRRNLYKRIECVFPVYSSELRQEILDILNIQLADNVSARLIDKHNKNVAIEGKGPQIRSQQAIYEYLRNR